MGRVRTHFRRHRTRYAGTSAAAILVIGATVGIYVGTSSHVPYTPAAPAEVLLWLQGDRDFGRLPNRSGWCSLVRSAEHCWLMQEDSGDAIDSGAPGGWDLAQTGSPRRGVLGYIAVDDGAGSAEVYTEEGTYFDGQVAGNNYLRSAGTVANMPDATNLVTITIVWSSVSGVAGFPRLISSGDTGGIFELMINGNNLTIQAQGPTTTKFFNAANSWADMAPHCATVVLDGRSSDAALVWVDGADETPGSPDLSGTGVWRSTTGKMAIGNWSVVPTDALTAPSGVFRARIDYAALTQAQHQILCGTMWAPPSVATNPLTKIATVDMSWTQTGGARCFALSGLEAICVPGGTTGYAMDWSGYLGWPLEPDRTNRILWSVDLSNAAWGGTATPAAAVAPDGSKTAWSMALSDVTKLNQAVTGYGASAALDLRFWAKCATGTLKAIATVGSGDWSMDCTSWIDWRELDAVDPKVTVNTPFQATAGGALTIEFLSTAGGASPTLWLPTLTEGASAGISTIPTAASPVATGGIAWTIDNNPAAYYLGARGKITLAGTWFAGGCLDITSGSNVGRQYSDGTDWFAYDSTPALAYQCDMPLSGLDIATVRWDSTIKVGGGLFAECLLNGSPTSWDATPSSGWTAASPSAIELAGYGSSSCTAVIRELKIEDQP